LEKGGGRKGNNEFVPHKEKSKQRTRHKRGTSGFLPHRERKKGHFYYGGVGDGR